MNFVGKGIANEIEENRVSFSLAFLSIFTVTFLSLAALGATPDPLNMSGVSQSDTPVAENAGETVSSSSAAQTAGEAPTRIVINSISLDASVANPTSTDNDVLDQSLLKGAVRYPTSATLGQNGTVLLFGHSSYLPIVHNSAYKTFDGIQNLHTGDAISVYSATKEYRYKVTGVRTADATRDSVDLLSQGQHLTLITCDSFKTKSDRFVVTADFVGTYSLAS